MPRYTNEAGVVVDIPAELAQRLGGHTPVATDSVDRHLAIGGDDVTAPVEAVRRSQAKTKSAGRSRSGRA